jgi:hypothetical protein
VSCGQRAASIDRPSIGGNGLLTLSGVELRMADVDSAEEDEGDAGVVSFRPRPGVAPSRVVLAAIDLSAIPALRPRIDGPPSRAGVCAGGCGGSASVGR